MHTPRRALLVMAKRPYPGRTKTRLCPPLLPEEAAGLYECFLRDVLDTVSVVPDITPFIEFMLQALLDAIQEAVTDQVGDHVTDQVARLIKKIEKSEKSAGDLMKALGLSHRATFRKNYLKPALEEGLIELTQPNAPRSPTQRYRLTDKGRRWCQGKKGD